MANIHINNTRIINDRFQTKDIVSKWRNWFSPRTHSWGVVLRNLVYSRFEYCVGFRNPHYAAPILKSTMRRLWEEEPELLDTTSRHRFRDSRDVTQFIFRYWHYATNQFEAEKVQNIGKYFKIQEHNGNICKVIRERQYPQVCLNDGGAVTSDEGVQAAKEELSAALDSLFPEKSRFES